MKIALLRLVAIVLVLGLPFAAPAQQKNPPPGKAPASNKMTCEEALKIVPQQDPGLVPLEKSWKEALAKLNKSPKDAKVKAAYVETTYKYGHTILMEPQGKVRPAIQYRAALALYRRALAVDPKHKPSLEDKAQIEAVYKTLPGGIPK